MINWMGRGVKGMNKQDTPDPDDGREGEASLSGVLLLGSTLTTYLTKSRWGAAYRKPPAPARCVGFLHLLRLSRAITTAQETRAKRLSERSIGPGAAPSLVAACHGRPTVQHASGQAHQHHQQRQQSEIHI